MKISKIVSYAIIILSIGLLVYYAIGQFEYHKALKREEDKWINEVFKPKYFEGVIYQLDKNDSGNCFTNFIVSIGEEKFSTGICLCGENSNFSNFAEVGDSVLKKSNSFKIIVIKKTSATKREFDFPFCDN